MRSSSLDRAALPAVHPPVFLPSPTAHIYFLNLHVRSWQYDLYCFIFGNTIHASLPPQIHTSSTHVKQKEISGEVIPVTSATVAWDASKVQPSAPIKCPRIAGKFSFHLNTEKREYLSTFLAVNHSAGVVICSGITKKPLQAPPTRAAFRTNGFTSRSEPLKRVLHNQAQHFRSQTYSV